MLPTEAKHTRTMRWAARALAAYAMHVSRRCVVVGAEALVLGVEEALGEARGRPIVLCYFIADVVPLLVIASRLPSMQLLDRVQWVCDDTVGGLITADAIGRLGGRTFLLPWTSSVQRIAGLRALRRTTDAWGISVDGHGPYGRVSPALLRLLGKVGAVILPIGAVARPRLQIRLRARLQVPLWWGVVAGGIGVPLDPGAMGGGDALALERRLADVALASARQAGGLGVPRVV